MDGDVDAERAGATASHLGYALTTRRPCPPDDARRGSEAAIAGPLRRRSCLRSSSSARRPSAVAVAGALVGGRRRPAEARHHRPPAALREHLHLRRLREAPASGRAEGRREPGHRRLRRDRRGHEAGHGGDRGPSLLRPRRRRLHRHRPRPVRRRRGRRDGPGRLDDHPAVHQERLPPGRPADRADVRSASSTRRPSPYQLEKQWSKDQILTNYLNTIYFGQGAYGIEMAARTYFGRPARRPDPRPGGAARRPDPAPERGRPPRPSGAGAASGASSRSTAWWTSASARAAQAAAAAARRCRASARPIPVKSDTAPYYVELRDPAAGASSSEPRSRVRRRAARLHGPRPAGAARGERRRRERSSTGAPTRPSPWSPSTPTPERSRPW